MIQLLELLLLPWCLSRKSQISSQLERFDQHQIALLVSHTAWELMIWRTMSSKSKSIKAVGAGANVSRVAGFRSAVVWDRWVYTWDRCPIPCIHHYTILGIMFGTFHFQTCELQDGQCRWKNGCYQCHWQLTGSVQVMMVNISRHARKELKLLASSLSSQLCRW